MNISKLIKEMKNMIDFLDLAKKRYSVRSYEQKEVEEEKLLQILEAGRVAPTAANVQPQRLLVIKSQEALKKLSKCGSFHGAPLVIIICGDHNNVWVRPFDSKNMIDIDTSIVADHMMMAAQDLGLGSCWLTYFNPVVIREVFNIPSHIEPVSILTIGYAAGKVQSPDRHNVARKPLEDILYYDSF